MDIIVNGIYQHYKGGLYKVIGIASHSETLEKLVIYISLTNHLLWARPLSMWCEEICIDDAIYPRFTYIGDKMKKYVIVQFYYLSFYSYFLHLVFMQNHQT